VRGGQLRDRVTIQQQTTVADTQGGRAVTWGTLATVWARVEPLSAREQLQSASLGSRVSYRATIRQRGDVTPKMRLDWTPYGGSAKTLEIHGVTQSERRDYVMLDCGEVA